MWNLWLLVMGMAAQAQVTGGADCLCRTSTGHWTARFCLNGSPREAAEGAHHSSKRSSHCRFSHPVCHVLSDTTEILLFSASTGERKGSEKSWMQLHNLAVTWLGRMLSTMEVWPGRDLYRVQRKIYSALHWSFKLGLSLLLCHITMEGIFST